MQKTTFPIEIIIHDDASTDGTAEIGKEYAEKYPELIVPILQKENQYSKGISPSPTYVWPRARGKYIALCEGDDYWTDPYKLQKQVDFLEENEECSMCFSNAFVLYENGHSFPHPFNKIKACGFISLKRIISSWIIPTASIVFRKEHLNLPLPSWTKKIYSGDLTLALLLADKGPVYFFNEFFSIYRRTMSSNSISYRTNGLFVNEHHLMLLELFDEYTEYRHNSLIAKRMVELRKDRRFSILKNKMMLLPFFIMPRFSLKKLVVLLRKKTEYMLYNS